MFNLASFFLQNSFALSIRLISPNASLCALNTMQWLSRLCIILERRLVLILLRVEQEHSLIAFVAGASKRSLTKTMISANRFFLLLYKELFAVLAVHVLLSIIKSRFYNITEKLKIVIKKSCHKIVCTQH